MTTYLNHPWLRLATDVLATIWMITFALDPAGGGDGSAVQDWIVASLMTVYLWMSFLRLSASRQALRQGFGLVLALAGIIAIVSRDLAKASVSHYDGVGVFFTCVPLLFLAVSQLRVPRTVMIAGVVVSAFLVCGSWAAWFLFRGFPCCT